MRSPWRSNVVAAVLGLSSFASAQVASVCRGDACFKLNIPQNTASSGTGDIFFQISAPSSWEWVALGQGTSMSGSNIFVVYTSGSNNNVTLSPRLGTGHQQPKSNGNAQVTLLEGSGVSGGKMIANIRCSSCSSWSGGSASFSGSNGNWIYAYHSSGGPKNSGDVGANIAQHDNQEAFQWSYANAKGGSSVNPLVDSSASGTASGTAAATGAGASTRSCIPRAAATGAASGSASASASGSSSGSGSGSASTSAFASDAGATGSQTVDYNYYRTKYGGPSGWPTASPTGYGYGHDKRQNIDYCDGDDNGGFSALGGNSDIQKQRRMLIAHGTLAALAFVIFFPAGAIAIRLASFPGVVWFHAAFQAFAYLVYIAAFGLGVYLANEFDMLNEYHPIIGIVVFVVLFFQPIFGWLHHRLFKTHGTRTFWSYAHVWLGRIAITLGIINGGLGMKLADTMHMASRSGMIAYGVVAGVVWLVWVAASIIGERRRKTVGAAQPPKYTASASPPAETAQTHIPHPENGHYAPK